MEFQRYSNELRPVWNRFVETSKNGYFAFHRDYLDYHRDRFEDHSLLISAAGQVRALLPAHRVGDQLVSHGGLTFGGVVSDAQMTVPHMLNLFDCLRAYCREQGFREIVYKPVPHIYHLAPAEEDLYALYQAGARLLTRRVTTAIDLSAPLPFSHGHRLGAKKAQKAGVRVGSSDDFAMYWPLLAEVLWTTYQTQPVHSLDEIERLRARFPDRIKLYACWTDRMIAGVVIYESKRVARLQYMASNAEGRRLGALDLLFKYLLEEVYAGQGFFDFGTSHNPSDESINEGLIAYKEAFGGRAVVCDTYAVPCL